MFVSGLILVSLVVLLVVVRLVWRWGRSYGHASGYLEGLADGKASEMIRYEEQMEAIGVDRDDGGILGDLSGEYHGRDDLEGHLVMLPEVIDETPRWRQVLARLLPWNWRRRTEPTVLIDWDKDPA